MKKYITERKWNQLYDSLSDGLCEINSEGESSEFTSENYVSYLNRVKNMSDYRIIGVRYQIRTVIERVKNKHRDYKLNHLNLGKAVNMKNNAESSNFQIKNISWDIHWQMNRMLAIIIRDYLRFFIKETPAIGNCVLNDNPEGLSYWEAVDSKDIDFAKRWKDTVNKVADEFDDLRLKIEEYETDNQVSDEEIQNRTEIAFKDLAYIFNDLSW